MKSRFLPTAANSFGFLAVALFLFAPIEAWSQPITPSALPAPPRAAAPATPTPAVPLAAAPTPDLRETSVTLAQIVERQDANFAR
ncbi:hypothetical protein CVU37_07515, partial [candidate division BRC1 bacterium HGW-BRC1-1]